MNGASIIYSIVLTLLFFQAQKRDQSWLWGVTIVVFGAITAYSALAVVLWLIKGLGLEIGSLLSAVVCGYVTKLALDRSGLRYRLKRYFRRGGRR